MLSVPTAIGAVSAGPRSERYADWDDFRTNSPAVQKALADVATRALPDLRNAECLPLPPDLPSETAKLGLPVASFSIPGRMDGAAFLLAFVCVSALVAWIGIAVPTILTDFPRNVLMMGIPLVVGVIVAVAATQRFLQRRVPSQDCWILDGGVLWRTGSGIRSAEWSDITSFRIDIKLQAWRCRLDVGNEPSIALDAALDPRLMPVIEFVESKATAAQFLPRLRAIVEGDGTRFNVITLNRAGILIGSAIRTPWEEVKKVVSDESNLLIDRGDAHYWLEAPLSRVSFPLLVKILSHIMVEEHRWLPNQSENKPAVDTRITEATP